MSQHNGHNGQNGQAPAAQGEANTEMSFYSEEVQEVLGRMPSWMERSGSMILLMLTVIGLLAAWMIHYPESIQSNARLLPAQAAVTLRAPVPLRLHSLLASDKQQVRSGLPILRATGPGGEALVLNAETDGVLHWLIQLAPGDTLPAETPVAAIAPSGQAPKVVAYVDETQYNQIDLGQKVILKTTNAQRLFGGALSGKVQRKSITPSNGYYEIGIVLDTPCAPIIAPEPVSATIILKDYRLIHRILHI